MLSQKALRCVALRCVALRARVRVCHVSLRLLRTLPAYAALRTAAGACCALGSLGLPPGPAFCEIPPPLSPGVRVVHLAWLGSRSGCRHQASGLLPCTFAGLVLARPRP
jgi:hypothetical protein